MIHIIYIAWIKSWCTYLCTPVLCSWS